MKNIVPLFTHKLILTVILASSAGTASAVLEKFEPYVMAKVRYDSNLFRVADNNEARALLGSTNKDDTIAYLGAGVKTDLKLSRQHLLFDAEAERAKYDEYDDLDHTRLKGRAVWAWQVGNLWSGQLGTRYERKMRSFTQTNIPEKDMRTRKVGFFDAGYQLHPDWQLVGGLSYTSVDYQERKILERNYTSGQFEVKYRNTLNTRMGLRFKHTDFDLKDREISGIKINNDYTEDELSATFYWEGSAKSTLEARLGYTWQSFDELNDRDYEGSTGRLIYHWIMTEKTRLDIEAWRETTSRNDEVVDYVLSKGFSISPVWSVTRLVSLKGTFEYNNDDFKARNDILSALGRQRRDDDTYLYSAYATWRPRKSLGISAGYVYEKRDSSVSLNDFTDNRVDARIKYTF